MISGLSALASAGVFQSGFQKRLSSLVKTIVFQNRSFVGTKVIPKMANRFSPKQLPHVVFVLGPPGAGKGTLCQNIVKRFGFIHLSAGDLLRAERDKKGSVVGELIEGHIQNGTIVPVEITCSLLAQAMTESGGMKFLIDGFPRNQNNLEGWNREMSDKSVVDLVIYMECKEEVCVARCLHRGEMMKSSGNSRSDDNEEALKKRFQTYVNATLPIIQMYEKLGLVLHVDAAKNPDDVLQQATESLLKISRNVDMLASKAAVNISNEKGAGDADR